MARSRRTFGGGTCGSYPCYDAFVAQLKVVPRYTISGQVLDGDGQPISDVQISAGGTYSATTDASGVYTITKLLSGTYTLTPSPGTFWSPETRTVTVPPDATGQDFTGRSILKESAITPQQALDYGDPLTYTVRLVHPNDRDVVLYDLVPTHTTFISGSLSAPAGVAYYTATNSISGTLSLTATLPTTVSFSVQVEITGTADFAPLILNRACVHPVDGGLADCEWSNEVWNFTYVWPIYLPLVLR
ncbi:MAG: carboxypeptidase regulatory-like domain-containing protein [Anaerolineae bacterium]|nr:carboxypeptidase regulatory-like domain-containing protein [Anaerolineae bacterium]